MSQLSDIGVKSVSLEPQNSPKILVVNQPQSQPLAPPVPSSQFPAPQTSPDTSQKFAKLIDTAAGFVVESAFEVLKSGQEFNKKIEEEQAKKVSRQKRMSVRR